MSLGYNQESAAHHPAPLRDPLEWFPPWPSAMVAPQVGVVTVVWDATSGEYGNVRRALLRGITPLPEPSLPELKSRAGTDPHGRQGPF